MCQKICCQNIRPRLVRRYARRCQNKYAPMYVKIHYYVSQHFRQNVDITGVPTRSKDMLTLSLSLYSSGKQLISVFVVWYFFHQHFHVNSLYRSLDFGALAVACQCHSTAPDFCAYPVKCRSSASSKWHGQSVDETQKGNLCTVST